tara:strand:+ start:296 stop:640 length:345 start_codon:yes stop_codon:yes gene_type:complete
MLKVVKYINYGTCMYGGERDKDHQKFLFSFFELNNKKIISVMLAENWNKKQLIDYDFNSCFTEYTFGQKWDKWWETTFKDSLSSIDDDSHIFIKTFFMKNVYPYRYEASDVIKF